MILIKQLIANANELDAMADTAASAHLRARLLLSAELQRKAAQALDAPKDDGFVPEFIRKKA